jgi:hypothetical protein
MIVNLPAYDILMMNYCKSVIRVRRNITVRVKILSYFLESIRGLKSTDNKRPKAPEKLRPADVSFFFPLSFHPNNSLVNYPDNIGY